ncbi:NACHT domain-containing protein [Actinoplanes oblitus]|uniref:NACHT domain-containing protein n=1 Tax=Actinoplanes oblitus TaxID=3040509 RepID=A0ABY8WRR3_9ACTN|nr:NACHT domain-containing protein [Actinoplanes oblitus]WIN00329.1 NACHT domain-containing protein [Actinoplanes oblitus]
MSGVEAALVNVGRAVVTPVFSRWLADRRAARERALPLAHLLRDRASDELSRRRGERQIEAVIDEVAERLGPLLVTRFTTMSSHEKEATLEAVADTFRRADLSDEALFATDLNPERLGTYLRRYSPPAALSELGGRLYDLVLDDCCACFVELVKQATPFSSRATVETLERLSGLATLMNYTIRRLELTWLPPVDFGTKYNEALVKKLNVMEMVGVEPAYQTRTKLNVAYIGLSASGDSAGPAPESPWEPGMVRHALSNGGSEGIEQALAKRSRTLIRGEAGAGKSTLLRWLAVTAAENGFAGALAGWNGKVPFLIKLRSWPERLPTPEQFLTGVADVIVGTMPPGWVHRQLGEGRGLLLVDGVDELPAERRPAVRAWVKELLDMYPESLMVVTSRPPAASVRWLEDEAFASLTLERMSPADVRNLIYQWHRAAVIAPTWPPQNLQRYEQSLVTRLAANRHLYRLAGNPLMAAMLCALNVGRETHLPADRTGVYQAAVDMLLHRRDTEREIRSTMPEMTVFERLQLLQGIAWQLSVNGRSELSRAETLDYLRRRLAAMPGVTASADTVLTHLVERSGLLREPTMDRIDFVHRTFQEYLTAREAADQNMGGMLAGQAHLDTWREIVIMAAGQGNNPMRTELIEGILRRADREPRRRRALILLVAACRETMPSLEPPELLKEIDRRLDSLLPPRNRIEARSLYTVGEQLLHRLSADGTSLTPKQAVAVIRTAALINGSQALHLIAGYADDARVEVQRELAEVWRYFDPEQYAERVLQDAPLDGGRVWITEPMLMRYASRLRNLTAMRLDCEATVDLGSLDACRKLTRLSLMKGWRGSTRALVASFAGLRALMLSANRLITAEDVLPLTELPELRRLWLYGDGVSQGAADALTSARQLTDVHLTSAERIDLSSVAGLPSLRMLGVSGQGSGLLRGVSAPRLTGLSLGRLSSAPVEPKGLAEAFPMVTELQLYGSGWPDDLGFVGDLPRLECLSLDHAMAGRVAGLRAPATLREVGLGFAGEVDLTALSRLSQLRRISLRWIERPVDLSPLSKWDGGALTITVTPDQRLTHRRQMPSTVRIRRVDPDGTSYE